MQNSPKNIRKTTNPLSRGLPALMAIIALATASHAGSINRIGLGIKAGESTGLAGMQVSYNVTRDVQINGGYGALGMTMNDDDYKSQSYFVAAKYYLGGWYASTGYTRKTASLELTADGKKYSNSVTENGIPLHLGYEFGGRSGFYTTLSAGYLHILGDGGRKFSAGTPQNNAGGFSAESGVSLGLGLGFYFL